VLSRRATIIALGLMVFCVVLAAAGMKFDASFSNLQFDKKANANMDEAREALRGKVYSGGISPGAVFMADDVLNLDHLLDIFDTRIREKTYLSSSVTNTEQGREVVRYTTNNTLIDTARSVRDYAPEPGSQTWQERIALLREIQDEMREGTWIERIENPDRKKWISEMRDWEIGEAPKAPVLDELPEMITSPFLSKDGKNKYLVAVFPNAERKNSNNAIRFTEELYRLVPESQEERDTLGIGGVVGPVGETPVYAEIVKIIKGEAIWLVALTFLGVFVLVWLELLKARESLFVMIPLVSGLMFTFGIMVILGMHMNLFNVIMIPALLGMGVDNGVHMFTRWKEYQGQTKKTVAELIVPLFLCTFTTMLGYAGMLIANHPGLRSIGALAILGMMVLWLTSVIMLPAMLEHFMKKRFLKQ